MTQKNRLATQCPPTVRFQQSFFNRFFCVTICVSICVSFCVPFCVAAWCHILCRTRCDTEMPASRSIVEASRFRDPRADSPRGPPLRPQPKKQDICHVHCAGMAPPVDQSSGQAEYVIFLHTRRGSQRSVPSRKNKRFLFFFVRA